MKITSLAQVVVNVLFPKRCAYCDTVLGFAAHCECEASVKQLRLPPKALAKAELSNGHLLKEAYACYIYDVPVRRAILRLKYEGERALVEPLGDELFTQFENAGLQGRFGLLVSAPMSPKALRKRGYNQSLLLAKRLSALSGIACEQAVVKTKETAPQSTLNREERTKNLKGAFAIADVDVKGKHLLLVDDVLTTGSTLNECAAVLLAAGAASCSCLCVAYRGAKPEAAVPHKQQEA